MFDSLSWRWMKRAGLAAFLCIAVGSAGCREARWSFWDAYAAHFIHGDGRVVDSSANDHTTSEGQSYALFFALADNDRARFDQLLAWTQNNLAGGDMSRRLPGWLWGKTPDGQWKLLDPNPASDADCWMAYTLIEAGKLWKNPAYTELGARMLAMIAQQEVADLPGFGSMLMPGATALWVHNDTYTLNPSYLPLFLFRRFSQVDPAGPWGAIAINIPRLLHQSARHGFAMDWVDYVPSDGFYPAPPPASPAKPADQPKPADQASTKPANSAIAAQTPQNAQPADPRPPMGSYDAIRVYLWAGMIGNSGSTRADMLSSLAGMGAYLSDGEHTAPPEKISAQGLPEPQDGPVGFSAAVLPYLRSNPAMARVAAHQRVRISGQRDPSTGLYGNHPVYYDQNLVLFALGYLDGRFRFGPHGELKVEWTR